MRHLSTLGANSVSTTAQKSTHAPRKSIEYRQLWSGSNILRDNAEIPNFAPLAGFWPNFEVKCAVSQPSAKVSVCQPHGNPFTYQTQSLEWLIPGLDGLTDKVLVKNLILRQMAEIEIDAFGRVANMRSLDAACTCRSIDCTTK